MRLCPGLRAVPPARRVTRVRLVDPGDGRALDDATAVFFEDGASFTGEESVEFTGHGSPLVLQRVVDACVRAGARPARPGEFTRRAVAGGRLDLVQAEAIALLGEASNPAAIDLALDALGGAPSARITRLREALLDVLAEWEATLDFIEDDGVVVDRDGSARALVAVLSSLDEGLRQAHAARPAVAGVRVAIIGPPNAGKSSLFNALLERDRAMVRPEPGTTRDVVGEALVLGGAWVTLLDTAGLRAADGVEAEGVDRAAAAAAEADWCMLVTDGREPWEPVRDRLPPGIRVDLVVRSKADLWDAGTGAGAEVAGDAVPVMACSARDGRGIGALRDLLSSFADVALRRGVGISALVAGERQVTALGAARSRTASALAAVREGVPLDLAAIDLRAAIEHLGEITGARVTEAVMDRVFRRFCVGK
jgi:tRNA modification GTPase